MTVTDQYTDGGPYSLDKIQLPYAHIVNGREFPIAFQLNLHGHQYDSDKVHDLLRKLSVDGVITELTENHGAVVLRDAVLDSDDSKAEEISQLIRTIEENRGHVEFQQNGTLGLRDLKGYNLYTASKAPAETKIIQHNEYSRFKRHPVTLVFTILEYTAKGGETPLVHGGELYQRIKEAAPDFLKKLSKEGLEYQNEIWPKVAETEGGIIWNHEVTFGRHIKPEDSLEVQKQKAEKLAKEFISENIKWTENDDLSISAFTRPVKTFKGEPLLFSSIAAFGNKYNTEKPKIKFGNGDLFDKKDLDLYNEITDELEYKHAWKSGDIVLVHNYQVSHGKSPYYDGKRVTLVGMWDEKTPSHEFVDYFETEA